MSSPGSSVMSSNSPGARSRAVTSGTYGLTTCSRSRLTGPEGLIETTLTDGTLTIRDHGPGFHEEDLPFVFDRFHRARDARSKPGSGLGLAIVRQAAEAHGGFVQASNAPDGGALMRIGFGPTLTLGEEAAEESVAGAR